MGFKGFRGFGVWVFWVLGFGFKVWGLEFRVLRFRVEGFLQGLVLIGSLGHYKG